MSPFKINSSFNLVFFAYTIYLVCIQLSCVLKPAAILPPSWKSGPNRLTEPWCIGRYEYLEKQLEGRGRDTNGRGHRGDRERGSRSHRSSGDREKRKRDRSRSRSQERRHRHGGSRDEGHRRHRPSPPPVKRSGQLHHQSILHCVHAQCMHGSQQCHAAFDLCVTPPILIVGKHISQIEHVNLRVRICILERPGLCMLVPP